MMEELEMRYAELNPEERSLKPYFDLTPDSNRNRALRLGKHCMGAKEQVMYPTCEKGDKGSTTLRIGSALNVGIGCLRA